MNADFPFCGERLTAMPSGALYWGRMGLLAVSDLHFGKSERIARNGGTLLPPYDTEETLERLGADVALMAPRIVLCLGDSFDDLRAAEALDERHLATLQGLQAGRRWLWLEGNHDPGPIDLGGEHLTRFALGPLHFRHIAEPEAPPGEISGHYHPKARVARTSRPCFISDVRRLILPAYGAYTGGLDWKTPVLRELFGERAVAYLTGTEVLAVPVPKAA